MVWEKNIIVSKTSDPNFCRAEILHRIQDWNDYIQTCTQQRSNIANTCSSNKSSSIYSKWSVGQKKNGLEKKYCNEHEWPKILSGGNFPSSVQDWNFHIQTCTQGTCNTADTCSSNMSFSIYSKWSVSQKKNALGKKYCNEHEWPKIFSGQNFTSSVQDWNYYIQTCTQRICNIADTCSPNMSFSIYSKWSVSQKKNALGKKYYCIENKWPKILSSRNLHRVFKIEIITFKPVHTGHAR